jgi:hypothetical protein
MRELDNFRADLGQRRSGILSTRPESAAGVNGKAVSGILPKSMEREQQSLQKNISLNEKGDCYEKHS